MKAFKSGLLRACLPALGLIAVLWLFHLFHDPYKEFGPNLLKIREWGDYRVSPWSLSDTRAEIRDDGVMVTQTQNKKRGRISCRINGVKPGELLRLRGEARADQIIAGKAGWQIGRTTLTYFDAAGKQHWDYRHAVGTLTGSCDWVSFELISAVQDYASYGQIWINNWGKSGRYEVRNLSLIPVRVKRTDSYYYWGAWVCLAGLGGWYVCRLNLLKRAWGWLVLLISICIFTGVLLPEKVVDEAPEVTAMVMDAGAHQVAKAAPVQKIVPALKPASKTRPEWVKRKNRVVVWVKGLNVHLLGHFGLFLLFGIACGLCFLKGTAPVRLYTFRHQDSGKLLCLLVGIFLFSVVAEMIQVVAISRTLDVGDWLLNIHGVAIGLILFVVCHLGQHPVRRLMQSHRKKAFC